MSQYKCVKQHDATDCAAAVLSTICLCYKKDISITKLRDICGTDIKGTNLEGLVKGAEQLGFDAKAIRIPREQFNEKLQLPMIAHIITDMGLTHFVLVYKITDKIVIYSDPAKGIIKEKIDKFFEKFDFTSIFIKPNESFKPSKRKGKPVFNMFVDLLKPHKKLFIWAIVASFILTFLGIGSSFFNKILMDEILPYNLKNQLVIFCIGFAILGLFQIGLGTIRQHLLLYLSQKIDIPLMLGYYKHIMSLPMKFFETRKVGEILTRFSDAGTIKGVFTGIILTLILDITLAIFSGIILYFLNSTLFFIVIAMTVISIIMAYIFKQPYKKLNILQMEQGARLNSQMIESLRGIETVKANAAEGSSLEKLEGKFIATLKTSFREGFIGNMQGIFSGILSNTGSLIMMGVGALFVMNGEITLGTLMAFSSLSGYFMDPIGRMVSMQMQIQEASIAMNRLGEIFEVQPEEKDRVDAKQVESISGDIKIKDLEFSYGSRQPVLKNFNLFIKNGEKVAIVGESGCGKTTLAKLLLGLWIHNEGDIYLGNNNIKEIALFTLRTKTAYVQQNIELFSGTIAENLRLGNENATNEQIATAGKLAGCDTFVNRLPNKYESFLEEAGSNLSGGEKQRLAIARALVKHPDILILDEATSNLDFMSEGHIYNTLFNSKIECTTLIIAHRLSTIRRCDKIFVMDKGKIAEEGTHYELLERKGVYYKLWNSQIGEDIVQDNTSKEEGLSTITDDNKSTIKEEEEIEYK